ncbi:MlaC/ttg2D family ABC transporter substrate-binding protein [Planctobacterium marinum]|uniref:MlaC/ttg2D family ABC transporter substrate-binding protein n=1 Tax=Planctobacterium marinum TaxID=1631968 RepID=UPI001E407B01|nr:ABC transporter substrate-binding protein [Planctobacterium marinum]MCC2603993.1 ABC transporter substrate-binding protein [Planctobacterium marinum]
MNKALIHLFCMILATTHAYSQANDIDQTDPYSMISQVANQTFMRIKDQRADIQSNPGMIDEIVEQELLPYVDYKFAALKVLGKHFKDYEKEKIAAYMEVFRNYSTSVFSNALRFYNDQNIEFETNEDFSGKKYVTVRALLKEGTKTTKLAFSVRKDNKSQHWYVYDINAEGISMISSLQSQFSPILRKEGLDSLMQVMISREH